MIEAKIVCDSINLCGNRLTTWVLTYPRLMHSEFMTHRMISKNSASSRAIPVEKMIKAVEENPAMPEWWGANQKGMQAEVELEGDAKTLAKQKWLEARDNALKSARSLLAVGLHKQIANRVLEPFSHITVLASGTEWQNFFKLRAHRMAQPEFQKLAFMMLELYNQNKPNLILPGDWHLPYGDRYINNLTQEEMVKISVARAARVSYNNFEGDMDFAKDFELHDRLISSGHFSPTEHAAQALDVPAHMGNFIGWKQYRKFLVNENQKDERVKTI